MNPLDVLFQKILNCTGCELRGRGWLGHVLQLGIREPSLNAKNSNCFTRRKKRRRNKDSDAWHWWKMVVGRRRQRLQKEKKKKKIRKEEEAKKKENENKKKKEEKEEEEEEKEGIQKMSVFVSLEDVGSWFEEEVETEKAVERMTWQHYDGI
ncbi:hypothetical protein B9Z55_004097 [Caenorhabditis nigoni]|uniref:Uncharacterized protein n=1 Tax=Caenorhabditis nigoni TaxID=1611254 RepID=A0A2G5UUX2_9PELO|nr:hypothetical protein B9Z55_004097 [Caenorhabditis nigoni]